ncbi:MBL fold metallo-hydrolase [Noviherbaspirillum saxi]|uniref:MBL fold metallo-hydrolase n=1 Tax=Noviherbaspirillum saxi TaxID=2320863 RepID=A0A3A3FKB7_9BURK|nr:MBL fold metallo-hydrolase [Noviherbaspirillum saxi]RJF95747.1 MBL fold metallo-hydrolase [Noviherbaspirillum saxi]
MNDDAPAPKKGALTYPCGGPPATGQTQEVASGVQWIRMPLPGSLTHINLWAIEDDDGWVIVDTGIRSDETTAAWCDLFAGPLGNRPATRVLVTHMHPDHIGMAGWLTRKFECRLWTTRLEYLTCRMLAADTGREAPADGVSFFHRAGWSTEAIERYRARFGNFGKMIYTLPDSYRRIRDGEIITIGRNEWQVIVGSGHTPEHACLYSPALKLLISGDQVLPRISSNVSVHPTEPDADPMGEWLASIDKLKNSVPNDVLVLPAHNEPFLGLHERLDNLATNQLRSLDRLREALQEPQRVVDVFGTLFARPILSGDATLLSLATGETIAHLNYLLHRGEAMEQMNNDGVAWYQIA